ncbi:hypothetical protein KA478_00495 [Patescibacteria group bacterium]|nr:hypothetical protein [Patescibacteria group bacterium]
MNHHEHHENEAAHAEKECCGAGCCNDEACEGSSSACRTAGAILKWVFLGGAFVCSLLTLLFLPKIIRKEIIAEQASKAGGTENYMRLSKEIYESADYKEMMKQQVEMFIQQNKAQMEMYKQQAAQPEEPAISEENVIMGTGTPSTGN